MTSILTIFFLLISFVSEKQPTDLKEYDFKGRVKSVTTVNYADLQQVNGVWEISENKAISKWKMTFNKEGNIVEMKEYYPVVDTIWNEMTTKIEFKNGLKSKYVKSDLFGQTFEIGNYTWIDNYNYKLEAHQGNDLIINSYSKLNKNFRDISGGYTYLQEGTVVFSESYINKLSPNGDIISSVFTDELLNKNYIIEYSNKEKDEKGNLIRVALVYKETQTLKRLSIRKFEYFE